MGKFKSDLFNSFIEASNFRSNFDLTPNKPFNTIDFLRKNKILTIFTVLPNKLSGIAIKTNKHRFIVVNSKQSIGKQNFTICHELYHLFIQENFVSMMIRAEEFDKKNKVEFKADLFASELLLPTLELVNLIPKNEQSSNLSLFTIVSLEQHFKCSRSALLIKLKKFGFINEKEYDQYKSNVKNSAINYGYDTKLYESGRECLVVGDYIAKAFKLFTEEKISESHYYNLMKDIKAESLITKSVRDEAM